jgi:hypothetical protein
MGFAARDYVTRRFSETRISTLILERYRAMDAMLSEDSKITRPAVKSPEQQDRARC